MANWKENEFWTLHPVQAQQLTDLCMKCPACFLKDENTWGGGVIFDKPYCANKSLHLDWVLSILLKEDGIWEFPEICYKYGSYTPKSYCMGRSDLKPIPGRLDTFDEV